MIEKHALIDIMSTTFALHIDDGCVCAHCAYVYRSSIFGVVSFSIVCSERVQGLKIVHRFGSSSSWSKSNSKRMNESSNISQLLSVCLPLYGV